MKQDGSIFHKCKQRLTQLTANQWTFFLALSFILTGLFAKSIGSSEGPHPEIKEEAGPADTMIPRDHVLIPIEVSNQESLNGLIGPFALVDLFSVQKNNNEATSVRKGRKIASRVRLIRAPLNPQKFAVLIHERQSEPLLSYQDSFFVVIQNRDSNAASEVHPTQIRSMEIRPEISYQTN